MQVAIDGFVSYFTERTISFERENYTFIEDEGPGEVCINRTDLSGVIEVVISPVMKGVDNPAAGMNICLSSYPILPF